MTIKRPFIGNYNFRFYAPKEGGLQVNPIERGATGTPLTNTLRDKRLLWVEMTRNGTTRLWMKDYLIELTPKQVKAIFGMWKQIQDDK